MKLARHLLSRCALLGWLVIVVVVVVVEGQPLQEPPATLEAQLQKRNTYPKFSQPATIPAQTSYATSPALPATDSTSQVAPITDSLPVSFNDDTDDTITETPRRPFNGTRDVFISVKTTAKFHAKRLDLIIATWFQQAPLNTHFFTDVDDQVYSKRLNSRLINTRCSASHSRRSLACKMARELAAWVRTPTDWFCHFDDDNYVNVERLYQMLAEFDASQRHYLGKTSTRGPLELSASGGAIGATSESKPAPRFWFATGGAGFCLSRALGVQLLPLVLNGRFMEISETLHLPDDVTVGYIIENELATKLQVVDAFHSHLEPLKLLRKSTLDSQISFSYSQYGNELNVVDLTSPTQLNDARLDQTRFLALHCHLFAADCELAIRRFKALKADNNKRRHKHLLANDYNNNNHNYNPKAKHHKHQQQPQSTSTENAANTIPATIPDTSKMTQKINSQAHPSQN